eukprot:1161628-Pelagomonas_calceolata.AAC.21
MLADPASNSVWGSTKVCLMEAEAAAYEHPQVLTEWPNLAQGRETTAGGRPVARAMRGLGTQGSELPQPDCIDHNVKMTWTGRHMGLRVCPALLHQLQC